jgi:predicted TIM-barrel fold metal-dependent hydrolase
MEAAASRSDTRKMYQLLKSIRSKSHKPTSTSVEDENGKLLSNNTEIINRWKEHFDKLLNQHQLSTAIDDNQRCHNQVVALMTCRNQTLPAVFTMT